jgi:hypothetical protein
MINLREELGYVNRLRIKELAEELSKNEDGFVELLDIALGNDEYLGLHASVIVKNIAEINPELVERYITNIVNTLPRLEGQGQIGNFLEVFEILKVDVWVLFDYFKVILANPDLKPFLKMNVFDVFEVLADINPDRIQELIRVVEDNYSTHNTTYLQKSADVLLLELKDLELINKNKNSAFL